MYHSAREPEKWTCIGKYGGIIIAYEKSINNFRIRERFYDQKIYRRRFVCSYEDIACTNIKSHNFVSKNIDDNTSEKEFIMTWRE